MVNWEKHILCTRRKRRTPCITNVHVFFNFFFNAPWCFQMKLQLFLFISVYLNPIKQVLGCFIQLSQLRATKSTDSIAINKLFLTFKLDIKNKSLGVLP